ncbi:MAG TPA: Calx-beta domain-containing protein [Pyrinomonadaceae bacterium]
MQKQSAPKSAKSGFKRFAGILAVIFIAAIIINALPSFNAHAESFFGWNATEQKTDGLTAQSVPEPRLFAPGACDIGNNIEVEGTNSGNNTGYATLAAAFAAINAGTHTGTITIDVCGNTTETATAALNQNAGVTSVTISPAGGAARTISGAIAAGSPLINLNGADFVTIDGLNTGGNSLTISNTTIGTTAGTSTIRFIADASNNTVTNTTILGSSTSTLATVAGTIVFSTGTTTGNDNNTISNNNIGPAGANLPSKAIMASGTSSSIENDNAQITGNNIFDFFLPGSSLSGINIITGNEAWTISNNKFYQTATRTFTTTALRYAAITLNNSTGGFTVTGNAIGFGAGNGTGTTTITGSSNEFRAIDAASVRTTAPATEIQNNIISGISQTSSRATTTTSTSAFIAVAMGTTDGLINATGNTVGSLDGSSTIVLNLTSTTAGTAPVVGFYNFSFFSTNISSNNIGAITIQSGGTGTTTGFRGILVNTTSGQAATINSNVIGGTNAAGAITDTQVGSYAVYGIQSSLPNLTAIGNTVRNMSSASNGASLIVSAGILASGATGNNTISRNTIHSLSNASGAAANSVYGMSLSLPATTNVIERNFIHSLNLTSTVTGTQIWGISGGATGTATYRNNMIRLGIDAAGNSITLPTSMIGLRDAAGSTNQFYHNTIYIGGTGVLAAPTASNSYCFFSDVVTVTRAHVNNIFWNARSNAVGGGVAHLATREGGTAANPAGLTSNFNILYFSGTDGATGVFNGTVVPTLAAWRTATGQDLNSIHADPLPVNPNGTAATVDLHLQAGSPAIDQATNAGVTNDFDGETRPGANALFDIGADERDGIAPVANDIQATAFIDPTNGGTKLAGATFSPQASFTNNGTSAQTNVTVRYRICTDASCTTEIYNQTALIASMASGATVTVTFPSTSIASPGTYTIKARAELGTDTVPANDEIAGTVIVPAPFNGAYTVGAGGNYTSLTNNGGIFQAINTIGASGPVTIEITSSLSGETGANALNAISGGFSVTIKPQASVTPTITGSSSGCLINLNGADNVTMDGSNTVNGTTRDMTITNTNTGTSSAVVCLTSLGAGAGATNNTVKNTNIAGTTTTATAATLVGIFSGGSTVSITGTGADNDNNTIQNNSITRTSYGIYSGGASAANKNTGTVITQNAMNAASPNNITTGGVLANFEDGIQISRNDLSVLKHDGTTGTTNTAFGIALGVVPNNTVTTFTGSDVINASITRNKINGVTQLHSTGYSSFGIVINSVTGGTTTVSNNMISGVRSASTPSDFSAGIVAGGGTGSTTRIYHNSVSMTGTRGAATNPSYGLAINGGNPIMDVKNNIFYNTQSSTGAAKMYAIANASATFTNMTSSYNDLYVSGTNTFVGQTGGLGTAGTDRATLADWNTATGSDNPGNSKSVDPSFINPASDLHLNFGSPALDMGTPLASVTTDIDGDTRQTPPDIGADEIISSAGVFDFNPTAYNPNEGDGTVTLTVTRTGGSSALPVDVTYTLADGTATGGASCGGAVDYVNTGGTVSFGAGESSKTFTVTLCDDATTESSETFTAMLTNASNSGTIGSNNVATVTIADNDTVTTPGTIVFSMSNYTVSESAGTATITVNRTGGDDGTISANYATSNGTATAGNCSLPPLNAASGIVTPDYQSASGTITFTDGDTTPKTFTVTICDDSIDEPDETVNLSLSTGGNQLGGAQTSATLTITDNDEPSPPTVSVNSPSVNETDATNTYMTFTFTLSAASSQTVTVGFQTADGTATAGEDYTPSSGTVTFLPGDTEETFQIPVFGDTIPEADETFFVTLSNPVNATIGTGTGTATILNDDEVGATVQFDAATYEIDEGDDTVTITVTRSGNTTSAVAVNYATSNGTANGGSCQTVGYDYQTASGTLNFGSGETTKTFSFEICSDIQSENPPETVNLTLSSPTGGATLGTQNTATLKIIDAATQYRNPNPIFIPENPPLEFVGQASSTVTVAGAGSSPFRVRVTLYGFTHPSPDDIDALLVSPSGQKFVLVGDAGGTNAVNNVTLTFEDAATTPLPDSTTLLSGNYKSANHEAVPDFFAPAPAGPYSEPGATGTNATLNGTFTGNPNGVWSLYLRDDTVNGNVGSLSGGFGLEFIAPTVASVTLSGRVTRPNGQGLGGVKVSLGGSGLGERKYAITSSFGYYTFENVTAGDVYVISVLSKRYTFNPPNRIITVQEDLGDINFVSEQ